MRRMISKTIRGGGPLALFGAPTGRGAKYKKRLITATSRWSSSRQYVRVPSLKPAIIASGMTAALNIDGGRVKCVCSSSHAPGDGGVYAAEVVMSSPGCLGYRNEEGLGESDEKMSTEG